MSKSFPVGQRKRMLALIHIAKKQLLGNDDDLYRDVLESVTGKRSAGDLNVSELNAVLAHFEAKGFKVSPHPQPLSQNGRGGNGKLSPTSKGKKRKTQADKIRALWIEAHKAGVVKNRYEQGLQAFVKRMTNVERVEWLKPEQANKVIEALKQMIEVRGDSDNAKG